MLFQRTSNLFGSASAACTTATGPEEASGMEIFSSEVALYIIYIINFVASLKHRHEKHTGSALKYCYKLQPIVTFL